MKFLVGIISGIVLAIAAAAVASVAVASNTTSDAPATSVIAQSLVTPQSPARTTTTRRVQAFTGELSYKDTGAFELKIALRQNGLLVDRDVRLLVAHAKVSNRLGRIVRLPLEAATARVTGSMLPRSAWRLDDDGQLIPTFSANRVIVIATTPPDQSDAQDTQDTTGD